ncbi:MAG: PDZ domain-containing protein [Oscillospiraceae bacterium]|nr:PDZ domain-containing protein [Oscillospiraceae bacterium]MBQ9929725.1 PDZ domain-containing protein [Oscillospiraceae bacterium]
MENLSNQNLEQDSYKTGSTKPPKKRGGLVAVLLVIVILLAGLVSILGMMNIHLFRMLQREKREPISFAPGNIETTMPAQDAAGQPKLGLTVGSVGELEQRFYELPGGALITGVDAQGCAARAGLTVGDIIVGFNNAAVPSAEELEQALQKCQSGDRVLITIYRHRTGRQFTVTVILDEKDG